MYLRSINILKNYVATMAIIVVGTWFYTRGSQYHSIEFDAHVTLRFAGGENIINTSDALFGLCIFYALILVPYYWMRSGFVCDSRKAIDYLYRWASTKVRPVFDPDERRAVLTLVLKLFFVPLMIGYLLNNTNEVMEHWRAITAQETQTSFYDRLHAHFYLLVLYVLLEIDVFVFTLGYMIEIPALDNEIRSVDPTLLGWISCLICYPPFNQVGLAFFAWQPIELANYGSTLVQVVLAYSSLIAMFVYVWASVALGFRASNLTNRGIIDRWPYSWVRHPAYTAKNISWWIAAVPALLDGFSQSLLHGAWILTCAIAWTLVYAVRAITEERHLLMIDNGYAEYMQRIRYRFLPGLI